METGQGPVQSADSQNLNSAMKRSNFYMANIIDDISPPSLNKAKVFSLLNVKDGLMHVKLMECSSF